MLVNVQQDHQGSDSVRCRVGGAESSHRHPDIVPAPHHLDFLLLGCRAPISEID